MACFGISARRVLADLKFPWMPQLNLGNKARAALGMAKSLR